MDDPETLAIYSHALGEWITLSTFVGDERLGASFEFQLGFAWARELDDDELDDLATKPALVAWLGTDGEPTVLRSGILASIGQEPAGDGFFYRARFVSFLWPLSQTRRSRVFQNVDLPALLKTVVEGGLQWKNGAQDAPFSVAFHGKPPQRDFCVQHDETDFAFLSRQLEREGAFYYFVDSIENGPKTVFVDHNDLFEPLPDGEAIPFDERTGVTFQRFDQVSRQRASVPRHTMLQDYTLGSPDKTLFSDQEIDPAGVGLVFRHGENFATEADGKRLAKLRAEADALPRHIYRARGNVKSLRPGHCFRIEGVNVPMGWPDDEWYAIAVHHHVSQGGPAASPYMQTVEFAPLGVPFRTGLVTPRPRIEWFTQAKIDGEIVNTAAPIDDLGRYKVVFPWDTNKTGGGKSSCRIPMAQPSSGDNFGFHTPLHIGVDVLVGFINGDPDRPVIVGSIPAAHTHTPIDQENASSSMLRSKGGVVLQIDDDAVATRNAGGAAADEATIDTDASAEPNDKKKQRNPVELWVRVDVHPDDADLHEQEFVLSATDGSYTNSQTIKSNSNPNEISVDLHFTGLWDDLSYSLVLRLSVGTSLSLFSGVPYSQLAGVSGTEPERSEVAETVGLDDGSPRPLEQVRPWRQPT